MFPIFQNAFLVGNVLSFLVHIRKNGAKRKPVKAVAALTSFNPSPSRPVLSDRDLNITGIAIRPKMASTLQSPTYRETVTPWPLETALLRCCCCCCCGRWPQWCPAWIPTLTGRTPSATRAAAGWSPTARPRCTSPAAVTTSR